MANAEFVERRIQSNGSLVNFNIDRSQNFIDTTVNGQKTRVFGTTSQLADFQNKKPDGTDALGVKTRTGIPTGKAKKIIDDGIGSTFKVPPADFIDPDRLDLLPPNAVPGNVKTEGSLLPNPLEQFASYTPLWTLAVLTPKQFNKPDSYRTDDLSFASQAEYIGDVSDFASPDDYAKLSSSIIFSSAGRGGEFGRRSQIDGGISPEYFVDNFKMTAAIAPSPATGTQNVIGFEFQVTEPYSMGLLLQSMQVAANKAGYPDYLTAPFLLRLDFRGFNDNGQMVKSIKPKHFVLKLKKVTFDVTEAGSVYEVSGYPYNHQAFSDTVDSLFQDISIAPKIDEDATVKSILGDVDNPKSLVSVLNANEAELVKQGKYDVPDVYEVQFPERSFDFVPADKSTSESNSATIGTKESQGKVIKGNNSANSNSDTGNNKIADSKFDYNAQKGGNFAFRKEADTVDEKTGVIQRGKVSIDPKNRVFNFTQKMKLTDVIEQVILSSNYSTRAVKGELPMTEEGYVQWFKTDVQVEFLGYDESVGDFAKKYTFRVVPYLAHNSVFTNPTAKPPGQDELKRQICKEYNYIYSGQNNDIIDFNITINNLFYTGINPAAEANTKTEVNNDGGGTAGKSTKDASTDKGPDPKAAVANLGKSKVKRDPNLLNTLKGGSGYADVEKRVAENFHNALVSNASADLIKTELTILGDTFWLIESGMNNYFAPAEEGAQFTQDGTANYEGNDVFIRLNFRTPIQLDESAGQFAFSDKTKYSPFSGIYRVFRCENEFSGGVFKQTLHCVRMQGQAEDYDGEDIAESKTGSMPTNIGDDKPPKKSVAEETPPAKSFEDKAKAFVFNNFGINIDSLPAGVDSPKEPEGPKLIERRRQSNGELVNFNIDRTQPFVDEKDAAGNTIRIFETGK